MKITEIRLGSISVPLRVPFKTALRTVTSVEDIILEIHTDTGAVGYGEAPPTGVVTGDTTGGIIDAILNGSINKAPTKKLKYFEFDIPTELAGVDTKILDPRDTYADPAEWDKKAQDLAGRFIKNFKKYETDDEGRALVAAGPKL